MLFDFVKCSKRLRDLRNERKESHDTLAKCFGVDIISGKSAIAKQTLLNYEQAARNGGLATGTASDKTKAICGMSIETLATLSNHFGVSADYLLGLSDYRTTDADTKTAAKTTGLSEEAVSTLRGWTGNKTRCKLLSDILTSDKFADALRYLEMACGLQSKFRDVPNETKGAVDYFNYLSATHEHGGGNIELAPSDKVKFCRQETVDILSDIIKDIIDKEGANNG